MQNLIKRLEKKGWGKKEIKRAVGIIQKAKESKSKHTLMLEKQAYWILLIVIIVANFAIAISLIPVLMLLSGAFLYLVIIVLGIVFGLLFELVIRSMEHLESKHHIALAVLIPVVALINIITITNVSNNLTKTLRLKNLQNPTIVALIYAVSFVLPYIIYRFILKIGYYAKE